MVVFAKRSRYKTMKNKTRYFRLKPVPVLLLLLFAAATLQAQTRTFRIILENQAPRHLATINIIDIKGNVVKTINLQSYEGAETRINISTLIKGEYICRVTSPEGVFSKLFMKE